MKKYFTVLYVICYSFILFAFDITGHYYGVVNPIVSDEFMFVSSVSDYRFEGNRYYLGMDVPKGSKAESEIPKKNLVEYGTFYNEEGVYSILELENNIKVITFQSDSDFTYKKRLGILYNERRLFLYDNDIIFFEPGENYSWDGFMPEVVGVRCSSFLIEKNVKYDGTTYNRRVDGKLRPWVENLPGEGIGEWIELNIENGSEPFSTFIISNGYISFSNPNLFNLNSRVKKMRIVSEQNKLDITIDLQDTTELQSINLPVQISEEKSVFRFIILETYPGDKWSDTCLNLILPIGRDPFTK